MNTTTLAHLASAEPADIWLGTPLGVVRSLYIGDFSLTFSASDSAESAGKQAAILTALSNAAIEAAHWLEDIAADVEQPRDNGPAGMTYFEASA